MKIDFLLMTAILLVTLCSPVALYYGVKLARKKDYKGHRKLQNFIFTICTLGVVVLEILIRYSGGSGSIAERSRYYGQSIFTLTLVSHIIVATLTYLLWAALVIVSNLRYRKTLPGKLSVLHKRCGYIIFCGLIYTAITALAVYLMSWNFI